MFWKVHAYMGICQAEFFRSPQLKAAVRAVSQDEAQAIASADPSVKAGLNRIEVAEMRIVFLPK
jgi:hypothetical protein